MSERKRPRLEIKPSCSTKVISTEAVREELTEYNMNYPRRGLALILHHYKFSKAQKHLKPRKGSEVDLERLKETLSNLEFEIRVYEDQTVAGIKKIIKNLAKKTDHSDCDCLLVVVLTHGLANSMLYAKDGIYSLQELWNPFKTEQCPTLEGKPKLFFIQACRGNKVDSRLVLIDKMEKDMQNSECEGYTKPSCTDFLIAYSSVEGYGSFRNTQTGTWFIQSLCEMLETLTPHVDILTIMTRIINRVAMNYGACHYDSERMHFKAQVPCIHSTLTNDVYFRTKKTGCDESNTDIKHEQDKNNTNSNKEDQHNESGNEEKHKAGEKDEKQNGEEKEAKQNGEENEEKTYEQK